MNHRHPILHVADAPADGTAGGMQSGAGEPEVSATGKVDQATPAPPVDPANVEEQPLSGQVELFRSHQDRTVPRSDAAVPIHD
ncbi:hypothetical protein [Microbacterium sp. LWO12-1.2]|uniref:hypothetical protein n=1 Tax=Microbacterium sp. LWO12-1.2 TaxID=3135261 RepID=UPI0034298070